MKKTLVLSIIALLLTTASISYFVVFSGNRTAPQMTAAQELKDTGEDREITIAAPGYVEPVSEEIEIGAEISGKLKTVTVEEGDAVITNQIVAVLENADYMRSVETARAEIETLRKQKNTAEARLLESQTERERVFNGARLEERRQAKAEYEQTLPNVDNARREFERRERLYNSGDVSREELERVRTAFENAQKQSNVQREKFNVVNADARKDDLAKADAAIKLARKQIEEFDARIEEAEARVREAEARLEKSIIRAPVSGIILRKRLNLGESFSPESPTGIVTIADTSALRVRVEIDETDVTKIREGLTSYVTADAFGDRKFPARVSKIGQILGRKNIRTERPMEKVDTKILEVLLDLEPDQKLPLGLRVDVYIPAAKNN